MRRFVQYILFLVDLKLFLTASLYYFLNATVFDKSFLLNCPKCFKFNLNFAALSLTFVLHQQRIVDFVGLNKTELLC